MINIKSLILTSAISFALVGCDEHPNADDQRLVDNEIKTPLQKSYDTIDDCKKEFNTDGDCTQSTVVVNGESHTVFVSPYFYPWGAIYHPWGWGYGNTVPSVTSSSRITTTTLPPTVSAPNFSNSSSYASARASSLAATRGGFGGTARAASVSGSSGGGSAGG